jgi:hypothetical protein
MPQESPPAAAGGGDGRRADGEHCPTAPRPDQADGEAAVPIWDVLQSTMRAQGLRRLLASGAPLFILGVLPASAGRLRSWRSCFCLDSAEGMSWQRLRRHGLLGRGCLAAGLALPEGEEGDEAEKDRGREYDQSPRGQWVERPIEKEAEPLDHRAPPPDSVPMPGGWA